MSDIERTLAPLATRAHLGDEATRQVLWFLSRNFISPRGNTLAMRQLLGISDLPVIDRKDVAI